MEAPPVALFNSLNAGFSCDFRRRSGCGISSITQGAVGGIPNFVLRSLAVAGMYSRKASWIVAMGSCGDYEVEPSSSRYSFVFFPNG
jgi:hypothetical protein